LLQKVQNVRVLSTKRTKSTSTWHKKDKTYEYLVQKVQKVRVLGTKSTKNTSIFYKKYKKYEYLVQKIQKVRVLSTKSTKGTEILPPSDLPSPVNGIWEMSELVTQERIAVGSSNLVEGLNT